MFYFIILNRDGKHYLENCIPSLINQTYKKIKIIIIDTFSKDGSTEYIKSLKNNKILLIEKERERGYAYKNNIGIKIALKDKNCKAICLLNNDTQINKNFSKNMLIAIKKFKDCGIFSPKYFYFGTNKIQVAGGGYFTKEHPTGEKQIGSNEIDKGQYNKYEKIDFAYGAGWTITPKTFKKIGLLDNDWFLGFEEPDYCKRAIKNKINTLYVPNAIVEHAVGGTSKGNKKTSIKIKIKLVYARNYLRFLIKHYSLKKIIYYEGKRLIKCIKKPHLIILELYSITWNLLFLPKTIFTRWKENESN